MAYSTKTFYKRSMDRQNAYERRRSLTDDQSYEICKLFRPDIVGTMFGEDMDEGKFEGCDIIESTGPYSAQVWQRGFQAGVVSRKTPWFKDRARESSNPDAPKFKGNDDVNQYIQDFDEQMFEEYRRSTFYDVVPHYILDGGTVGSPVMLREESIVDQSIICKVPHYSQRYLDKDIMGRDNVLHVKWEWDALTVKSFFKNEDLPVAVRTAIKNGNFYEKQTYIQAIYGAGDPIFEDLPDKVAQTHPWMEFFFAVEATGEDEKVIRPLNRGPGYFHRPFSTWHYWRNWHEVYARTPAWWAIYDVRGGNALWEALYGEAELSIKPPVWAMGMMEGMLDLGPGGSMIAPDLNTFQNPPQFLERGTRYDIAMDFANRIKESIERHYHVPFFLGVTQAMNRKVQPETAFGLMLADMEKNSQVGPEVETYEGQVLSDNHEAFVEIARRAGRLPVPPDILLEHSDDGQVDVEFIGELSRAQARDRTINNFFKNIGIAELAFKWAPETVQKIRWSQALEKLLEAGNFPQADIMPEKDYQRLIDFQRQQQKQEELMAQLPGLAKGTKDLQHKTEEGSPLEAIAAA